MNVTSASRHPLAEMQPVQDLPADPHSRPANDILRALNVTAAAGLDSREAAERLHKHGPNRLTQKPPRPGWLLFLDQFRSYLIVVLLFAAVLAGVIGDFTDAVVILFVILLNAFLGFQQEQRAERSLAVLKNMLATSCRVRRGGIAMQVPADELVPGDIVLLDAGARVPADGRLVQATTLEIDESPFTGESVPVGKNASIVCAAKTPLAEHANMAFMNTCITRGRGECVVVATGMQTQIGHIAQLMDDAETVMTPLQAQLDAVGKRLAVLAGAVAVLLLVLGLLRGDPLMETLLTAVALAVAAIPEGLPAVVTVTLAIGMHIMARQKAIVKQLSSVETLGCTTVICSDKTGTLTLNQMMARSIHFMGRQFSVSGNGYESAGRISADDGQPLPDLTALLQPAALCTDCSIQDGKVSGDPMEGALLVAAAKGGINIGTLQLQLPRTAEVPFDSTHKFMATFHRQGDVVHLYVKGAPEILLPLCGTVLGAGGVEPLPQRTIMTEVEHMAGQALRVLAVASRDVPLEEFDICGDLIALVRGLTFVGLIGLMDPPREEARDAIALCHRAGIQVKMITGDHRLTAASIAAELGITGDIMTGAELEGLSVEQLAERLNHVGIFARVAPEHKVKIVQALKRNNHVVAMTGDGVNDAPALKAADIGIAMGISGTDVAKEAAKMVLTNDNFATIVDAVKEGRRIYDNIVKFLRFQVSTNAGAIFTMLAAPLFGLPVPFTALQILLVNIIMDGPPAMALGLDPANPNLMQAPPRRPEERVLSWGRLAVIGFYGAIMAAGTLLMLAYGMATGDTQRATTLAFTTFVLFQFCNAFNVRSETSTAFAHNFFSNWQLWAALITVIGLLVLVINWPLAQAVFHMSPLSALDWVLAASVALSVLLVEEVRKLLLGLWLRKSD
ncbi:MAG: cation-translocating P-type ATPase [Pseudomonadota bacterium]